jgi:hypothetical protein
MTTTRRTTARRLATCTIALIAASATAVAVSDGVAGAQPRDPCADRAHQAQVALDIAHGWWVVGETLTAIGDESGADDAYAYADYFFAEYEMSVNDAC